VRIAAPLHKLLKQIAVEHEVTLDALVQDVLALGISTAWMHGVKNLGTGAHFAKLQAAMVTAYSKKQAPKA